MNEIAEYLNTFQNMLDVSLISEIKRVLIQERGEEEYYYLFKKKTK